jgi:hypothetical protein
MTKQTPMPHACQRTSRKRNRRKTCRSHATTNQMIARPDHIHTQGRHDRIAAALVGDETEEPALDRAVAVAGRTSPF